MKQNPIWKLIIVFFLVALIFSIWGGERDRPDYALGIVKEDYTQGENPLSQTLQAAMTIAFNEFFSEKELDFSLHIEFITFSGENNDLEKNTETFLEEEWEVLAFIGSTDPLSSQKLAEIAEQNKIPVLSPFFLLENGEYSFSLIPSPGQLALSIRNILEGELGKEDALILGTHHAVDPDSLKTELEDLGIRTRAKTHYPQGPPQAPVVVLDPSLLEGNSHQLIFVLASGLETLYDIPEPVYAVICPSLTGDEEKHLTFREEYEEIVGKPDYFSFNAYDSLYFILEILEAAGREPPDMQRSFHFFETELLRGITSFSPRGKVKMPLPLAIKIDNQELTKVE